VRKKSSGSQSTGAPPSGASLLRPHFIDPDARDVRIALRLNAALEALGDRWSLLVVRDMLFEGARSYREFASSAEGIATNILAARLRHLEKEGIIGKSPDPTDGRRWVYTLTPKGLDLVPALVELILWGARYHRTVAPPAVIRRMTADREGFIASIRSGARRKP